MTRHLYVQDAASCPVAVQIKSDLLPKALRKAIAERLEGQWKQDLAAGGGKWFLEDILSWAEAKYSDLLQLVPEYVSRYDTGTACTQLYVSLTDATDGPFRLF